MGIEIRRVKMPHDDNMQRKKKDHMYELCNTILKWVTQEKYLVELISNNLSWTPHIQKLGFLRRNLKGSPRDLKKLAGVHHDCHNQTRIRFCDMWPCDRGIVLVLGTWYRNWHFFVVVIVNPTSYR